MEGAVVGVVPDRFAGVELPFLADGGEFGGAVVRVAEHAPEGVPGAGRPRGRDAVALYRVRPGEEVEGEGDAEIVVEVVLAGEHGPGMEFGVVRPPLEEVYEGELVERVRPRPVLAVPHAETAQGDGRLVGLGESAQRGVGEGRITMQQSCGAPDGGDWPWVIRA